MGWQVCDEGWVVELFQIVKCLGLLLGCYIIVQLCVDVEQNWCWCIFVSENIQVGLVSDVDCSWLVDWYKDMVDIDVI